MVHTLFLILSIILVILGFVDLIRSLTFLFLKIRGCSANIIIIPVKGHNERVEFLLRSAASKIRWMSPIEKSHLICLDCGMDDETKKICNLICDDYDFMDLYNINELETEISQ